MKIRTDFYSTTNRLFWIYEHEEEYFLVDSLPHSILGIFRFYRIILFKMKVKQITKEKMEKYKNLKYNNTGEIIGVSADLCTLLGSYLTDELEKLLFQFILRYCLFYFCAVF